uniref:Interferon-upsilon n=3 Tax=Acipenseridae TaxID=7900 RepID=A0AAU7YCB6_ACIRT
MSWVHIALPAALVCLAASALSANKQCIGMIPWKDLLKDLEKLNRIISPHCIFDYDKKHLCDPEAMVKMVKHDTVLITEIMNKTAWIYGKKEHPFPYDSAMKFINGVVNARIKLHPCGNHPSRISHDPVTKCFNKMDTFLTMKANSRCAWEIVHATTREMLQRLERCSLGGRR